MSAMPMPAASPAVFDDSAPLWRDAIVGASVAAMAAAAGLGAHFEIGTAPWISIAVGGATAVALWGAHRQLGGTRQPSRRRAASPSQPDVIVAPVLPTGAPPAPVLRQPPVEAPAPLQRGASGRDDLSAFVPRPQPSLATPASPPHARVQSPIGATQEPLSQAPTIQAPSPAAATATAIDPEAQFLHLQGLVRQLAAEVPGPRALSVDPDRRTMPADELPPMRRGFADPEANTDGAAEPMANPTVVATAPVANAIAGTPVARLAEAVAAERFDVLLEPIQRLAEARTRHFEISVRFRDNQGVMLEPGEVKRIARNTGLATSIDALKLPRVAKIVQKVQSRGGVPSDVLTALAGASLADHAFMESFAAAFPVGVPGALVLSLPQADVRAFGRVHWSALSALSDMGMRFALDDVSDLDMDFELLRARQFVFAKLETAIFLGGLPCAGAVVPPRDICRHLEAAGLDVVVTGIDSEDQLADIVPHAVPFAQGKLFGGARPVKADILK